MNSLGSPGNIGFFLLINLNIIIVMVLAFLVVKNVVKLILDRRRNIFGSRMRARLVGTFVGLSLIPTVLLFLVARGILENVMQGWFSPQIVSSVDGSIKVARHYYEGRERDMKREATALKTIFEKRLGTHKLSRSIELNNFLTEKLNEHGLLEFGLLDPAGEKIALVRDKVIFAKVKALPPVQVPTPLAEKTVVRAEQSLDQEFLRSYTVLTNGQILLTTIWIQPKLNQALAKVISAFDDYKELTSYQRPLASTYLLTLVVVMLMVVFAAIWVGFYLARSLSGPIQQLAEATEQIAHGNLDFHVPEVSDDELGVLVHSFNVMTDDLKRTTHELVDRRRYMETILANVGVGVVSIDHDGCLQTINTSACEMLGLAEKAAPGETLAAVFGPELARNLSERLYELYAGAERSLTFNASRVLAGRTIHLQVALTKLSDNSGIILGAVILLDNLTELVGAQRMAAWREVARRIAHEIKNPLTPIQLSAQRVLRRFSLERAENLTDEQRGFLREANEVIVKQVDILRNLVNEFSRFARMPKSQPRPTNLNTLLQDSVIMFQQAHPEISFELLPDEKLPLVSVDPDQLNRVLVNLLDNAVVSLKAEIPKQDATFKPLIQLRSGYEAELDLVTVSVADNGQGVADADKPQLFEPYFSMRKGGTGLGLAIVRSIIADHQGVIRVRDNSPRGAVFTFEMPVEPEIRHQER